MKTMLLISNGKNTALDGGFYGSSGRVSSIWYYERSDFADAGGTGTGAGTCGGWMPPFPFEGIPLVGYRQ